MANRLVAIYVANLAVATELPCQAGSVWIQKLSHICIPAALTPALEPLPAELMMYW
jgi:hypothetical protein